MSRILIILTLLILCFFQAQSRVDCYNLADPHARAFNGRAFEAQTAGDWLMYKGEEMEVAYRGFFFNPWVGIVEFIVKMGDNWVRNHGHTGGLLINGEEFNLKFGETHKLPNFGWVRKTAPNKLTISTGKGEETDFLWYAWGHRKFFNTYVRSNKPNTQGICNQQFIPSKLFTHPQPPRVLPPPALPACPKKELFEKYCYKHGMRHIKLMRCIFDLCAGLNKQLEAQIMIDKSKEDAIKLAEMIKRRQTCHLVADPHAKSFEGRHFEAQTEGDWVLYKGDKLQVHYRGKRFGTWVGIIKFGIILGDDIIYSEGFKYDVTINGEKNTLAENQKVKLQKGYIIKVGNKVTVSSGDGEEVDFLYYGYFYNAFVRSNAPEVSGLCSQQFVGSKFFIHPQTPKVLPQPKMPPCPNKEHFKEHCDKQKAIDGAMKVHAAQHKHNIERCLFDLCSGLNPKVEDQILKQKETENKKLALKVKHFDKDVEFQGKGSHWVDKEGKKIIRGFGKWKVRQDGKLVDFFGQGRMIKHKNGKIEFHGEGNWNVKNGKDQVTTLKGKAVMNHDKVINLKGKGDWKIKHKNVVTKLKGHADLTKGGKKGHIKVKGKGQWEIKNGKTVTKLNGQANLIKGHGKGVQANKVEVKGKGQWEIKHGKTVTKLNGEANLVKGHGKGKEANKVELKGKGQWEVKHGNTVTKLNGEGHVKKGHGSGEHQHQVDIKGKGDWEVKHGKTVTKLKGEANLTKGRGGEHKDKVHMEGKGNWEVTHGNKVTKFEGEGKLVKDLHKVNLKGKGKWEVRHGNKVTKFNGEGDLTKQDDLVDLFGEGDWHITHGDKVTRFSGKGRLRKDSNSTNLQGKGQWHITHGDKVTRFNGEGNLTKTDDGVHMKGNGDWHITHGDKVIRFSGEGEMRKNKDGVWMDGDGHWHITHGNKVTQFSGKHQVHSHSQGLNIKKLEKKIENVAKEEKKEVASEKKLIRQSTERVTKKLETQAQNDQIRRLQRDSRKVKRRSRRDDRDDCPTCQRRGRGRGYAVAPYYSGVSSYALGDNYDAPNDGFDADSDIGYGNDDGYGFIYRLARRQRRLSRKIERRSLGWRRFRRQRHLSRRVERRLQRQMYDKDVLEREREKLILKRKQRLSEKNRKNFMERVTPRERSPRRKERKDKKDKKSKKQSKKSKKNVKKQTKKSK